MTDQRARAKQLTREICSGLGTVHLSAAAKDILIQHIESALADERWRVWEEAAKMACSRCAVGMPRNEHWFHQSCDATKYWLKAHAGQEG